MSSCKAGKVVLNISGLAGNYISSYWGNNMFNRLWDRSTGITDFSQVMPSSDVKAWSKAVYDGILVVL